MYDPYTGKRKHQPAPAYGVPPRNYWNECGVCLLMVLMVCAVVFGASLAVYFFPMNGDETPIAQGNQLASPDIILPTITDMIVRVPTETPTDTPRPSATPSASPTSRPLGLLASATPPRIGGLTLKTNTPTPFILPPSPTSIRSAEESPLERFEFFAENSDIPASVDIRQARCDTRQSRFTLTFDHRAASNLYYLEVSLAVSGEEAVFTQVVPLITEEFAITQNLTITLNDTALNLTSVPSGSLFKNLLAAAWEEENLRGVENFSLTWANTGQQPLLSFEIQAEHPYGGGVLMAIRWARDPDTPLVDNERLTFQVC